MSVRTGGKQIGLFLLIIGVVLAFVMWPDIPLHPPETASTNPSALLGWILEFTIKGGVPSTFFAYGIKYA